MKNTMIRFLAHLRDFERANASDKVALQIEELRQRIENVEELTDEDLENIANEVQQMFQDSAVEYAERYAERR